MTPAERQPPETPALQDVPEQWPVTSTREIHRDDWVVEVHEDTLHRPGHDDEPFDRLVITHPGAVMVLAVDEQERVCCLRQYRHVAGRNFVELPAGICDHEGEDPVETAKRELKEEAELQADEWRHLLTLWPTVGLTNEVHHLYLARRLSTLDRGDFEMAHEEAEIVVFWAPMQDLLDAVLEGRVQQGPLAAGVLAYDVLKRRGEI
ncbi:NUDIX hydrolase [Nocardioides terrisoli]|uniref:NUDIX hydrolase n=1 Tax=Nocardioides terrisoli TaxID=3388267 RepID=UPI00287BB556|nr:NUDIX hydrolase [Nocardioides marmorisolisilvae]